MTATDRDRFEILTTEAKIDSLALVECTDARDGRKVPVVCAQLIGADGSFSLFPLAQIVSDFAFTYLRPPVPGYKATRPRRARKGSK